ncbi:MAG: hypothetical protein P8H59_03870 [Flavobacteriales bacterium]|nr:hypothetical protein [Flavobacteriales bacterium]MDG1780064.1 hypothetical protein [Flavobacteriales bacterium]MDG2246606.1 hypothetical protein [Flavobacteriales bacterium]
MNKSIVFLALLGFGVLFSISSCKKDTEDEAEETISTEGVVTFSITNPSAMSTYGLEDTVHVDMMLSAEIEFHGYEVEMVKVSNDSVVYSADEHDHGTMFHIHDYWVNDLDTHSDMELRVKVYLDHDAENVEEETVMFHCHPM